MSDPNAKPVDDENLSAGKLVVVGIITLAIAFAIINFIAETGINKF